MTVLREDEHLGPLIERHGEKQLEPAPDFFRRFVVSITRQQLSVAAAAAILDRLEREHELTPVGMLHADTDALRAAGLSAMKVQTIHRVAERFATGDWRRERFEPMADDAVLDELTTVRGIGIWTAKMQLMFSLGRMDVFPVEDLGIRRGMEQLYGCDLTRADMCERANAWRPYRSLASLYLWDVRD